MILENMEFLLDKEEPWTLYRTLKDLHGLDDNDLEVMSAKELMIKHPLVQGLIKELDDWPGVVISSHKSAGQLYHKLEFLADIGLTKDDEGMLKILEKVMAHPVSYTHLRAHETDSYLVCRL